ncbi:MAG: LysM peptidoglycan-binding domain-containing protein [Patescibacteria group bacterium]
MQLKALLKTVKLYESTISMILGALVLAVAAFLVFSYFRNLKVGQTTSTSAQNEQTQVMHVVTAGETLWSISQDYYNDGFAWTKIAEANSLSNPENIEKGTQLIIPEIESKTEVATTEVTSKEEISTATNTTTNSISTNSYTVAKGDSLWTIAVRAYGDGYKWTQIAKVNNLKNPDIIFTGTALNLPRAGEQN